MMRRQLIDGRPHPEAHPSPGGIYLYQRIHTLDGRPLWPAEHLACLDTAARRLFGRPAELEAATLVRETERLLALNGFDGGSVPVLLRLHATGERVLQAGERSLYRGYALRSLRPVAAAIPCTLPGDGLPTSARRETMRWALYEAVRRGAKCVIPYDAQGVVRTANDAPLFGVKEGALYTSPAPRSVERDRVVEAAAAAGIRLFEQPVGYTQLRLFDELLYFDCHGLTAIASCDDVPYMDITARRLAEALQRLIPQR